MSSTTSSTPTSPALRVLALIAIAFLAAFLRFSRLTDRGLFFWDEAKFALEGIRMEQGLRMVAGLHASLASGKPVGSAKPGHALLIGVSYAITGVHDYAPLLMNAACSVVACVVLAALGWRLFGREAGIVAGLLLAVSEYDILYARSALSESDATMLLLIGVAIWVWPVSERGRPAAGSRLLLSAVVLGAAFSTNYRLVVYLVTLVAVDLIWSLKHDGLYAVARRASVWVPGLLVVPAAWLLVGVWAGAHGPPLFFNEITGRRASYAAEVIYQLHQGKQSVIRFDPAVYVAWYVNRNGVAASALLGVGLAWCLLRPRLTRIVVVALVLVPYLAYTFAPFIVPRNLVAALPFAALTASMGLVETARRWPPVRRPLLAILPVTLALVVIGGSMSWRLTKERSGFVAAARTVQHGGGRALSSTEVMAFYLRRPGGTCSSPAVPLQLRVLAAEKRAGYRLAVLEQHHNSPITDFIHAHGKLLASWPVFGGPDIGESPVASENGTWPNPDGKAELVYLFDISGLPLPAPRSAHPEVCVLRVPI